MFVEIDKFKLKISDGKTIHYIPNIISMGPLDQLYRATEWLFREAKKDYDHTNKIIERRKKFAGGSKKNLSDVDEFSIRLGARTLSYVIQTCLMEDILSHEYKRMSTFVSKEYSGKISINPQIDCKNLKSRFSSIRTFRRKVAAHTAYTYPKPDDNPETVVRSILNLFPAGGRLSLGYNFFSGFSKYKSQIPIITIFDWETIIKPIFRDWKELFIKTLKKIGTECPLKNGLFRIDSDYYHSSFKY